MPRSIANKASIRRTASSASGVITTGLVPCTLRRALSAKSAITKNGSLVWAQHASKIRPALRPALYSLP